MVKQCPTKAKYDRQGNLLYMLLAIVLSLVKPCDPCWEIYHALKIKIMYTPHIPAAPTLGVRKNMFSIHPKMFYSCIGNRHKNVFVRINAPNSFKCLSWKVSVVEERHGLCKSEKKRRVLKKWISVWDIENNGYSDARLKKREKEMNKIAHVSLQSVFQVSIKRDMF